MPVNLHLFLPTWFFVPDLLINLFHQISVRTNKNGSRIPSEDIMGLDQAVFNDLQGRGVTAFDCFCGIGRVG